MSLLLLGMLSILLSAYWPSSFIEKSLRAPLPVMRYIHFPWIEKGTELRFITCEHCENSAVVLQTANNKVIRALCEHHFRYYLKKNDDSQN